jgi:hypothetical protein
MSTFSPEAIQGALTDAFFLFFSCRQLLLTATNTSTAMALKLELITGFEPVTSSLPRKCSTD